MTGPDCAVQMVDIFLQWEFDTFSTKNHFHRVEKLRKMVFTDFFLFKDPI